MVDPTHRLVLGPERCEFAVVEEFQQLLERLRTREEQAVLGETIEEHTEIEGEFIEQGKQELLVADVAVEVALVGDLLVELEPIGIGALADGGENELPFFRHAEGTEAVEDGESLLLDQVVNAGVILAPGHPVTGFGALVGNDAAQTETELVTGLIQTRDLVEIGDGAVGLDAKGLEQRGDFATGLVVIAAEEFAGLANKGGEAVAGAGVEHRDRKWKVIGGL